MKQIFALLFIMTMLVSCSTITNAVYGPDMTPDQIRDAVYQDSYAVGSIRVSVYCADIEKKMLTAGNTNDEIKDAKLKLIGEIQGRIDLIKGSNDPMSLLNQYIFKQMANSDPTTTIVISLATMAGRRVLSRLGIKVIQDGVNKTFESADLDFGLFLHAVEGYEKAVKDYKASL
jgi:hypothetical protein